MPLLIVTRAVCSSISRTPPRPPSAISRPAARAFPAVMATRPAATSRAAANRYLRTILIFECDNMAVSPCVRKSRHRRRAEPAHDEPATGLRQRCRRLNYLAPAADRGDVSFIQLRGGAVGTAQREKPRDFRAQHLR